MDEKRQATHSEPFGGLAAEGVSTGEVADGVRASVTRVSYWNDTTGWAVVQCIQEDDQRFTATGHFVEVRAGENYQFFGEWVQHAQYGRQLKVERAVALRPTSAAGIALYLSSCEVKGLGPKTAEKIATHFGKDTFQVLDSQPERIREVPSIGRVKGKAIVDGWEKHRAVAEVMMFLTNYGISPHFAYRILKLYGSEAIRLVSADPYRLAADIPGIGFQKADAIARRMGIALDSPLRIKAAIEFTLLQAEEKGHCFVTTAQLVSSLGQILGLDSDDLAPHLAVCLDQLRSGARIISETITHLPDRPWGHARPGVFFAEAGLAQRIERLVAMPFPTDRERVRRWLDHYCRLSGSELSSEQLDAVHRAVASKVFILTGGPGVGKTTTANAIIRLVKAMGRTVALAAPTGRAAQRLSEVASCPAKTIHRMLEWAPGAGGFGRNETNPLAVKTLVIDEASMLDVHLADALTRALPDDAQLILIGDVDQLPSVGPGNVLRDMIESRFVECVRLTQIFRQASQSSIVRSAHAINRGDYPEFGGGPDADCLFIPGDDPAAVRSIIMNLLTRDLPQRGFDPVRDVQILTPMNRGDLGTQALNEELQSLLNPRQDGMTEYVRGNLRLAAGDKVIQVANNYELGVYNGDIGFVISTAFEGGKVMVAIGERQISYDADAATDLRLAYAVTIHKAQGSEFPAVVIPVTTQHYVMLERNLVYTALTRARRLAVFVGTSRALGQAIRNMASQRRQTRLGALLAQK